MANYAVLQATKTFFVETSEGIVRVVKGDLVRAGHEVTKGRDELFAPLKVKFDYDVKAAEQKAAVDATAVKQGAAKVVAEKVAEVVKTVEADVAKEA